MHRAVDRGPGCSTASCIVRRVTPTRAPADVRRRLEDLAGAVRRHSDLKPRIGMVLGSGLGDVADALRDVVAIPFSELPGWPEPSAPGHAGRLLLGTFEGVPVACLQGRLHLYEGHEPLLVCEPVLLMGHLGADAVLLTNASGGINTSYAAGTLMVIEDHINMTGRSPLIGANNDSLGDRFPDMVDAWSPRLRRMLREAAAQEGIAVEGGVYVQLSGPNYETPAEVRMLRALGADAVGMSTVMEAIAARWAGLEMCGLSVVTNPGAGVKGHPLTHHEVLDTANEAGPTVARVLRRFVRLFLEADIASPA